MLGLPELVVLDALRHADFTMSKDSILKAMDKLIEQVEGGPEVVKQRTLLEDLRQLRDEVEAGLVSMSAAVTSLSAAVTKLNAHLDHERSARLVLEADMQAWKANATALQAALGTSRQLVLLGQLAYTVDWAAGAAIQRERRSKFTTIEVLVNRYNRWIGPALSDAESQRYRRFERFLAARGFSMDDAVDLTRAVRGGRTAVAHGTDDELASTTVEQLASWAPQLKNVHSDDMEALMRLSALFAADADRPLLKKDVNRLREEVDAA